MYMYTRMTYCIYIYVLVCFGDSVDEVSHVDERTVGEPGGWQLAVTTN
jgi:hypothetical protein